MTFVIPTTFYLIIPYVLALGLSFFLLKKQVLGILLPLLSFVLYAYVLTFSLLLGSNLEEEAIFALLYLIPNLIFYVLRYREVKKEKTEEENK